MTPKEKLAIVERLQAQLLWARKSATQSRLYETRLRAEGRAKALRKCLQLLGSGKPHA